MRTGNEGRRRHRILDLLVFVHLAFADQSVLLQILGNALTDRTLHCSLADLRDVGTGEALGCLGHGLDVHVVRNGALPQRGLENADSTLEVRKWDVDELVQPTGTLAKPNRVSEGIRTNKREASEPRAPTASGEGDSP